MFFDNPEKQKSLIKWSHFVINNKRDNIKVQIIAKLSPNNYFVLSPQLIFNP